MKSGFKVKVITKSDKKTLAGVNNLLLQWSKKGGQMSSQYLKKLAKESCVIGLYHKENMIGMVTLIELYKISGKKGSIEHLIVDKVYRGRGLGKELMRNAIALAKKSGIQTLFLTSEPKRIAANALYKKLGFKIKKTNFYHKEIS